MPLGPARLGELIDRHAAPLRLWAGRACVSPDDAVQEALCRLATLDPPPDQPVAWLYRAVRNAALKQIRSQNRRQSRERRAAVPERQTADPTAALAGDELVCAVERLDDPLREVLVARIWGEMTLEEAATLCGISTATAWRRYQAALETIRMMLGVPCLNRND